MDQDDATIGRILTRREALRWTAQLGFGVTLAGVISGIARAAGATTQPALPLVASPELTEGPFFVDERLNRSDLVTGTTRASVVNGMPLALSIVMYHTTGTTHAPMKGVQIDLWHADAAGAYSDEDNPMNVENTLNQKWLRGFQRASDDGVVTFNTIIPGYYNGRAPHIHFKVRQPSADGKSLLANEFTSQLFFRDQQLALIYAKAPYRRDDAGPDTRNIDDGIYNERLPDGTRAGDALLLNLQPATNGKGLTATFPILLTDKSMHPARRGFGPDGPGGPGGSPPPDFGPPPMPWWS